LGAFLGVVLAIAASLLSYKEAIVTMDRNESAKEKTSFKEKKFIFSMSPGMESTIRVKKGRI
jgi:hypothetical protein